MPSLAIKNIPEELHRDLKRAAESEGRSLNSYVLGVLKLSIEDWRRYQRMRDHWDEFRRFVDSLPPMPDDSADIIREDRDSNHGHDF